MLIPRSPSVTHAALAARLLSRILYIHNQANISIAASSWRQGYISTANKDHSLTSITSPLLSTSALQANRCRECLKSRNQVQQRFFYSYSDPWSCRSKHDIPRKLVDAPKTASPQKFRFIIQDGELPRYRSDFSVPKLSKMKSSVQVLTTPTVDTPGSTVLLEFDDKHYVFGQVHEGCQRAMMERGKRMIKVSDLFITGKIQWKNTGGLMGLILTATDSKSAAKTAAIEIAEEKRKRKLETLRKDLESASNNSKRREKLLVLLKEELERQRVQREQGTATDNDESKPTIGVHGGKNLKYTVATCRRFVFRQGIPLILDETLPNNDFDINRPTWTDSNIDVFAMPVLPTGSTEEAEYSNPEERAILDAVVNSMFDSKWSLDALFETPLAEVQMPAAIFVRDPITHKLGKWTGPKPGEVSRDQIPDVHVLVRAPWPAAKIQELPSTVPSDAAMSYFVRCHPQRGKFLPQKAKSLGVPVTKYKDLASGEPVLLDNGIIIQPSEVLEPSRQGAAFAVVDLPSATHVEPLLQRPEWSSESLKGNLKAIFWILGPEVSENTDLTRFIASLPAVKHIISSPSFTANYLALHSAAKLELDLAAIDEAHHPVLEFEARKKVELPEIMSNCEIAHPGQTMILEPKSKWDVSTEIEDLNCAQILQQIPPNITHLRDAARRELQSPDFQAQLLSEHKLGDDVEVISLGTGSAAPSKYRNVSATLVRVPGIGSYLFDAGENTMGQLRRMFKPDEVCQILKELRLIWISHMHADHHLGLTSVIRSWYLEKNAGNSAGQTVPSPTSDELIADPTKYLNDSKLFVVSDSKMIHWLAEYSGVEDLGFSQIVPVSVTAAKSGDPTSSALYWGRTPLSLSKPDETLDAALRKATGVADIQAAPVDHCNGAKAVSITFPSGFKVSYSGDCRPSKRFVEIGRGSTLLIHEATFDDELIGDAIAKKHSTTSEAIKVGMEMGAPRVFLTHFSQRYAKLPNVETIRDSRIKFQDAAEDVTEDVPIENTNAVEEPKSDSNGVVTNSIDGGDAAITKPLLEVPADGDSIPQLAKPRTDVKVGVAFDYMRVKLKDFAMLEKFNAPLNALFENAGSETAVVENGSDGSQSPKKRKRNQ